MQYLFIYKEFAQHIGINIFRTYADYPCYQRDMMMMMMMISVVAR